MRTERQQVGDYGEAVAARYLRLRGYRIVARNWHADRREIDIIAVRFGVIAFVEVKTRTYTDAEFDELPPPRRAVDRNKQRFTRAAASQYLFQHPSRRKPRMDVIEVSLAPAPTGKKPRVRRVHHLAGAY